MKSVYPGLWVGDIGDYRRGMAAVVVSATQTVHYEKGGWSRKHRPSPDDRAYLAGNWGFHYTLNWVDGGPHLYEWGGPEAFVTALDFIDQERGKGNEVLVHCDAGLSRSPTLALIYLAKRVDVISNASFAAAKEEFLQVYPDYNPGGIAEYVAAHWEEIT